MNKKVEGFAIIVGLSIVLGGCTAGNVTETTSNQEIVQQSVSLPARPAEINGVVKSIEGNELLIANELKEQQELTDEEKEAQKEERQNLSQEERQALRESEMEAVETENINLVIPVGVLIVKSSGSADGTVENADLADIVSGGYVSVWVDDSGEVEAVKIKGVN